MIKVEEKEIIKGEEPVSGVILTLDEYAELRDAYEDICRQVREAEAANKEAKERLEALNAQKRDKEARIAALRGNLEKLENAMQELNVVLGEAEHLNAVSMKVKEESKL